MAAASITPVALALNTASADKADADGTVIDGTDGFSVVATNLGKNRLLLFKFVDDGTGCTVTINAGDNPPSMTAGLGAVTVTLAANDVKYIAMEQARVTQSDGTITGSSTDSGTKMMVFVLPANA